MNLPFELNQVCRVVVYKRDEMTTDLICCDVEIDTGDVPKTWTSNEEASDWDDWMTSLTQLPGFDHDWFAKVSQPVFASSETIVFQRRPVA